MDLSAAKEVVGDNLSWLARGLRISDWELNVGFDSLDSEYGNCVPEPNYRRAQIQLDPQRHANANELLVTLRHELLHVLNAQMEVYRAATRRFIPDGESRDALDELWHSSSEQLVTAMEGMLDALGMTPRKLISRAKVLVRRFAEEVSP